MARLKPCRCLKARTIEYLQAVPFSKLVSRSFVVRFIQLRDAASQTGSYPWILAQFRSSESLYQSASRRTRQQPCLVNKKRLMLEAHIDAIVKSLECGALKTCSLRSCHSLLWKPPRRLRMSQPHRSATSRLKRPRSTPVFVPLPPHVADVLRSIPTRLQRFPNYCGAKPPLQNGALLKKTPPRTALEKSAQIREPL